MIKRGIIFLIAFCTNAILIAQDYPYKNLVFEGAGMKGLAYAGAISVLEEKGILDQVEKVGGTSAGAITAMMISIGYNSSEIESIISETNFRKFNDVSYIPLSNINRVKQRFGWYQGDAFIEWLEHLIEVKTGNKDITFQQLTQENYIDLYITGTCLNRQKLLVFSAESYPEMRVKDAVRISMSIPFYFEAMFIDEKGKTYPRQIEGKELDIVIDGGIIGNYPIFLFDHYPSPQENPSLREANMETLGFRMDTEAQIEEDLQSKELATQEILDMGDYISAFYTFIIENLNRTELIEADWYRTVSISSEGMGPKIKKFSADEKKLLWNSGRNSTLNFLEESHPE